MHLWTVWNPFCHQSAKATAFATDVLTGSNPSAMGPNKNGPLSRTVSNSMVGDEGCPRAASPPAPRFGPAALACCAGKRFAFPQLRTLAGSNSSAMGPKRKGPHRWEPIKSVVGDEGCPRAAGAARAPLRRSAPRVLRWKTLRVSSAPHPVGFESHALGTKKKGLHHWRPIKSVVGDEGFEPPALCV